MKLADVLHPDACIELVSDTKEGALRELADALAAAVPSLDRDALLAGLVAREKLGTTAIGAGAALPHVSIESLDHLVAGFARSPGGVDFGASDGRRTQLFFALAAPYERRGGYLQVLAQLASGLARPAVRDRLLRASTLDELLRAFDGID